MKSGERSNVIKVLHPITRMIIGGAQENTMLTADYLMHRPNYANRYHVEAVWPQTGPEGSLIDETRGRGVPLTIMPDPCARSVRSKTWLPSAS